MAKRVTAGSVFQRVYRDRAGNLCRTKVWYVRYYVNGKPLTLPAGTTDHDEALIFLRRKMADSATMAISQFPERVKMHQLFDLVLDFYKLKERRTLYNVECLLRPANPEHDIEPGRLRAWFGPMKAQAITSSLLKRYISERRLDKSKSRPTARLTASWLMCAAR